VRWEGHALAELSGQRLRVQVKLRRAAGNADPGNSTANEPRMYAMYVNHDS